MGVHCGRVVYYIGLMQDGVARLVTTKSSCGGDKGLTQDMISRSHRRTVDEPTAWNSNLDALVRQSHM